MKTFVIVVYFGTFNGVPEVEAQFIPLLVECHERGISSTLYAREKPDIQVYTFMCVTVRVSEPGRPT